MKSLVRCLPLGFTLACCMPLPGQMLAVDRAATTGSAWVGRTNAPGFVADHFQVGESGQVWIVDAIRVWAAADRQGGAGRNPADIFEKASLFGGIEAKPPDPSQPPQPECDCHNLMTIKSGSLRPGGSDVRVSAAGGGAWQVDFLNLHWSIPGGVPIQYGVMGVSSRKDVWYNQAAEFADTHNLKFFDPKGGLDGDASKDVQTNSNVGLRLQVWAHRTAPVEVKLSGTTVEVVLRSDASFDAAKADPATLRMVPTNGVPIESRLQTVDGHQVLVMRFRRDSAVHRAGANVCVTGRQQDSVPFEGCDTAAKK